MTDAGQRPASPSHATVDGHAFLSLRALAKTDGRATAEYLRQSCTERYADSHDPVQQLKLLGSIGIESGKSSPCGWSWRNRLTTVALLGYMRAVSRVDEANSF
jgi:hypothetical protein